MFGYEREATRSSWGVCACALDPGHRDAPRMADAACEMGLPDLMLADSNPLAEIKLNEEPIKNFLLIMEDGGVYKAAAPD